MISSVKRIATSLRRTRNLKDRIFHLKYLKFAHFRPLSSVPRSVTSLESLEKVFKDGVRDINVDLERVAYEHQGNAEEMATFLRILMKYRVDPPLDVFNILLLTFSRNNRILEVQSTMDYMRACRAKATRETFNTLLSYYGNYQMFDMMLQVYENMRSFGLNPDIESYNSIISALAAAGDAEQVHQTLEYVKKSGIIPNINTYVPVIDMHSRTGSIEEMEAILKDMKSMGIRPNMHIHEMAVRVYKDVLMTDKIIDVMRDVSKQYTWARANLFAHCFQAVNYVNDTEAMLELIDIMYSFSNHKPDKLPLHQAMAVVLQYSKHPKDMIRVFDKLLSLNYKIDEETCHFIFRKLPVTKDYELAQYVYEKMLDYKLEPTSKTYYLLCKCIPTTAPYSVIENLIGHMERRRATFDTSFFESVMVLVSTLAPEKLESLYEIMTQTYDVKPSKEILKVMAAWFAKESNYEKIMMMFDDVLAGNFDIEVSSAMLVYACEAIAANDVQRIPQLIDMVTKHSNLQSTEKLFEILMESYTATAKEKEGKIFADGLVRVARHFSLKPQGHAFEVLIDNDTKDLKANLPMAERKKTQETLKALFNTLELMNQLGVGFSTSLDKGLLDALIGIVERGFLSSDNILSRLNKYLENSEPESASYTSLSRVKARFQACKGDSKAILSVLAQDIKNKKDPKAICTDAEIYVEHLKQMKRTHTIWSIFEILKENKIFIPNSLSCSILEALGMESEFTSSIPTRIVFDLQRYLNFLLVKAGKKGIPTSGRLDGITIKAMKDWINNYRLLRPLKLPKLRTDENEKIDRDLVDCLQGLLPVFGLPLERTGELDKATMNALHTFVLASAPGSLDRKEMMPLTRKVKMLWDYVESFKGDSKENTSYPVPDPTMFVLSFTIIEKDLSFGAEQVFSNRFQKMDKVGHGSNQTAYRMFILYLIKRGDSGVPRALKLYKEMKSKGLVRDLSLLIELLALLARWKYMPDYFVEVLTDIRLSGKIQEVPPEIIETALQTFNQERERIKAALNAPLRQR